MDAPHISQLAELILCCAGIPAVGICVGWPLASANSHPSERRSGKKRQERHDWLSAE
ncbi:hypothetical protein ATANTOWER_017301, partial [Ataeniobius toweri]|nr:hypothetical protein [Ataeniobius toweri]